METVMATEADIKAEIERIVSGRYFDWEIGVTDEPEVYRRQAGNPDTWLHWPVDDEQMARNVERYFFNKGFWNSNRGHNATEYVYILSVRMAPEKF
jgi:hypothetical protein